MAKKLVFFLPLLLMLLLLPVRASAEDGMAEDLSDRKLISSYSGIANPKQLFDRRTADFIKLKDGAKLTLESDSGIGSLYILFGREYGRYSVTEEATGESHVWGETGILHEFLDLEAAFGTAPQKITLHFDNGAAQISEIYAFTAGQTPNFVQKWEPPCETADLVLFSTHGDDEQLFFAGMLPYYGRELGYDVQVVYMTDHRNMTLRRVGEMLDGLWAVGLRNYPVFGSFGDYNTRSRTEAYQRYRNKGITQEDIEAFVTDNIRRFRPKVAVGHDLNGEYGHGMHMVYADALCTAVEAAADGSQFPDSAEKYGVWDVPKTYLHLYPENQILLDWDQPLESFGGMTAYEVTKDLGFPCHKSQQSYYSWYFKGKDTAQSITEYSPREFGLYRSTVGEDVEKNDFFENLTTYAQDAEQERLRLEEAARKAEEEQLAREAAAQTIPTESAVPETLPIPAEVEAEEGSVLLTAPIAAVLVAVIVGWLILCRKKK